MEHNLEDRRFTHITTWKQEITNCSGDAGIQIKKFKKTRKNNN